MASSFSLYTIGLFVVMTLYSVALTSGDDHTLDDNASGAAVVHAVITKLRACEILKRTTDHRFLRRTAYVESKDGKKGAQAGGIWKVNTVWLAMLKEDHRLLNQCTYLNTNGCQLSTLSEECTKKPLYSGLVVSFYIFHSDLDIPLSINITGQADLWHWLWYFNDNSLSVTEFTTAITNLSEACKVNKDIFFVLDTSRSIEKKDFRKVKKFLKEFVEEMTIGPNDDRVGIIIYGNEADIVFNLSNNTNKTDLLNAIKHNVTHKREATDTAEALCKLQYGFNESRISTTVLRIAIFMTDGDSTALYRNNICHQNTLEAAAAVHNLQPPVLVYAIGVSDNVNVKQLKAIATTSDKYFHIENFNGLKPLPNYYIDDICWKVAVNISNEGIVDGTLDDSEVIHYVLTIPYLGVTIQACSVEGIIQVYGSVTFPNPNSALNNYPFVLDHNNTECQNLYIPPHQNSTGQRVRSVEYQSSTENVLYISVEGASNKNNSFTMNMTEGDISDDCVGERVAKDCEDTMFTKHNENDVTEIIIIIIVFLLLINFFIVSVVIVCARYAVNRHKKRQIMEEDTYRLLDNEYHVVQNE